MSTRNITIIVAAALAVILVAVFAGDLSLSERGDAPATTSATPDQPK